MPDKKEKEINPNSFYKKIEGIYHHDPTKTKMNLMSKNKEPPKVQDTIVAREEEIPKLFDSKSYKKTANKNLEEIGADVRVYNKNYSLVLSILIGVIVIFGLFFVWSVSNDKFKTDFTCPDCNCQFPPPSECPPCPNIEQPDCICNQTLLCPKFNDTGIIDAINNFSASINVSSGS